MDRLRSNFRRWFVWTDDVLELNIANDSIFLKNFCPKKNDEKLWNKLSFLILKFYPNQH